ncbi:MAG: hypothetical protein JO041_12575 [Acidobacteria bacterium]|nr:hypothetical protein [Acidobacteriota bacterium]
MSDLAVSNSFTEQPESGRWLEFFIVVAKHKWLVLKIAAAITLLALATVFLIPKRYRAMARMLPPQQGQSMVTSALMSQLGSLGGLAAQQLGNRTGSDIYVSMLKSRTVSDALIDRFSLLGVYHKKLRIDAERKLASRTDIAADRDGVITVQVDDTDSRRAADLANGYFEELLRLSQTLAVTDASRRRVFFQREMKLASNDLAGAEAALKQTQESTGMVMLDSQARAIVEQVASVRASIAEQEIAVEMMNSYAAPDNPDLLRARRELGALKEQLARLESGSARQWFGEVPAEKVPAAALEYMRKLRDVKYYEALYETLGKQYEMARIDEARDVPLVQIMDKAVPPERHAWPKRAIIVSIAALLGLILGLRAAFWAEAARRAREDPEVVTRMEVLRFHIRNWKRAA